MVAVPTSLLDAKRNTVAPRSPFLQTALSKWQQLNSREKTLVSAALAVVAAALLWWVAIAPALKVLKTAQVQQLALDAQLQQMQNLQAEAKALQAAPKIKSADAAKALDAVVKQHLGVAAQVTMTGNQVSLTLTNVAPEALAQFLAQARTQANALPSQVRLRPSSNPQSWDGTLVLQLPAS